MPIVAPWSRVTCPYCFDRFHLSRAHRRQVGSSAPQVPDPQLGGFFGNPSLMAGEWYDPTMRVPPQWIKRQAHNAWRSVHVPGEAHDERMICRGCHIPLPDKIASGEASGEVIAVVGARNSGKSNFFGSLVSALRRRYMSDVGFDLLDGETFTQKGRMATSDLYKERYGKYLFDPVNPKVVPQTRAVVGKAVIRAEDDPRIPLIYMFRFRKRAWQHLTRPLAHRIPTYFMVYDAAGEDMVSGSQLDQFYHFIRRATGIIFLIDPFDYPGIRSRLPEEIQKRLPPSSPEPARIVDEVLHQLRGRGGRSASGKINIPVAFALTKADMFQKIGGLVYGGSAITKEANHQRGYDQVGCEALHREVMQYIREWDSSELLAKAENNFSNYQFFALSALGAQPRADLGLDQAVTPFRVADPLLWLFWARGFLAASKT